jgi:hypothetical protein
MNAKNDISELRGDIKKTCSQIEKVESFYDNLKKDVTALPVGKSYDLIILADIFVDFYTCLETGFLRASKFFENNLDSSKWHADLLEKMTVDIPGARKRVISDGTETCLKEFMRFRHFKRYYFEFEYDKDRIEFLEKKFMQVLPLIKKDLDEFDLFLKALEDRV